MKSDFQDILCKVLVKLCTVGNCTHDNGQFGGHPIKICQVLIILQGF